MHLIYLPAVLALFSTTIHSQSIESCDSKIYCQGKLLDTVQQAGLYNDSKSFVDLSLRGTVDETLTNFNTLMNNTNNAPTKDQLLDFVNDNFVSEGEIENWKPTDYNENPKILKEITDITVRDFARQLIKIWPDLARKVKDDVWENPEQHSLLPVPNGFIIPGGRFKEIYYWDSYWITEGLLISEMTETVRGILENFLYLVDKFGFIPNGSRVYYLNRSQPPLLMAMVARYIGDNATEDKVEWLKNQVGTLEKEMNYWLKNHKVVVEKDGVKYDLANYASVSTTPRPESYAEDLKTCSHYTDGTEKGNCYKQLKSGAESGWDFSSRWIPTDNDTDNSNLYNIDVTRIIPVDLNAYLCQAFRHLSNFYKLLENNDKTVYWLEQSKVWEKSIEQVLYNKEDGIWYDFDSLLKQPRKAFFPSNFAPLWAEAYDVSNKESYGNKAAAYFRAQNIMGYQGGIPTSVVKTGEQWDLPNAWPPLQEIVVMGLARSNATDAVKIAKEFARRWVVANMRGFKENGVMFEKYDAINSGQYGGGGEYVVQSGFGWTNGAVLGFIRDFYTADGAYYLGKPKSLV